MSNVSDFEQPRALPPGPVEFDAKSYEAVLPPKSLVDLYQYFILKHKETGQDEYADFARYNIARLEKGLDTVNLEMKNSQIELNPVALRLRPPGLYIKPAKSHDEQEKAFINRANDGEFVPQEPDIPPTTKAFMELTYHFTRAEVIGEDRYLVGEDINEGRTLLKGEYKGYPVFFVETYGFDDYLGYHVSWEVTDSPPEELMPASSVVQYNRPFLTTSQEEELRHDVYDGLSELPTAPIDESEVIKSWLKRQAA